MLMHYVREVARELLSIRAVKFDLEKGFPLKIHKKYPDAPKSPFYVDLRILCSFPALLDQVAQSMVDSMVDVWDAVELVSDVPTASTPIVTIVSQKTGVPMIRPRLDAKTHGLQNEIDGVWQLGQSVVVLDDLRTTGGSKEDVIDLFLKKGLRPVAVGVFLDRGGEEDAPVAGLPFRAVWTWRNLLGFYMGVCLISPETFDRCLCYPAELDTYIKSHTLEG